MKASNKHWVCWTRHCDGMQGVLHFKGPVHLAVEALQRSWAKAGKPTGLTYKVEVGDPIDALCASADESR